MIPSLIIYLLRHGETEGHKKVYKGHIDVPLSKEGERQVEKVARFLKNIQINTTLNVKLFILHP